MIAGPIRLLSVVASAIVLASFGLFAVDEARNASERSTAQIEGRAATQVADPSPAQERDRERAHGDVRELIDDANDIAISPFTFAAGDSDDAWVQRGIPALLALLVYGVGLRVLARAVSLRA